MVNVFTDRHRDLCRVLKNLYILLVNYMKLPGNSGLSYLAQIRLGRLDRFTGSNATPS